MKHLRYFVYVLRHKWYVMLECFKVGLYWRGLTHDLSKFRPSEWFPYVEYFYGWPFTSIANPVGAFKKSVQLHYWRNRHHPEHWVTTKSPMPYEDRMEMLCDWRGVGRMNGKPDIRPWYEANKERFQFHPETQKWVEDVLCRA